MQTAPASNLKGPNASRSASQQWGVSGHCQLSLRTCLAVGERCRCAGPRGGLGLECGSPHDADALDNRQVCASPGQAQQTKLVLQWICSQCSDLHNRWTQDLRRHFTNNFAEKLTLRATLWPKNVRCFRGVTLTSHGNCQSRICFCKLL